MDRDIYPMSKMAESDPGLMPAGKRDLIPPIEGVIDAFYKEGDHYRFVGKTGGDTDISVDVERGEMLADISGLTIRVKGEYAEVNVNRFAVYDHRDGISAELDVEPESRFRLKFLHER